ncbi:hypothetical protein [Dechloromonas sp. A34]|uniref:hypothetical protein n=1 Tax=Dechloromonas sp. A34 TaxID=447588 RepID=UPI0022490890|nr:hypothetical protein [Dechloromonas sp. A34]
MRLVAYAGAIAMALGLAGCTHVETRVTHFYGKDFLERGEIYVISADPTIVHSLEFEAHKAKIEQKLVGVGYSIAPPQEAKYVAVVSYGIDSGKTEMVSVPIFGKTDGETTYTSGTISGPRGTSAYSGTSYRMPSFGVVGASVGAQTAYTRVIAIDIVPKANNSMTIPAKTFELRAKSIGSCPVINGVFDEILEALFKTFPSENGKTRVINVVSKGSC